MDEFAQKQKGFDLVVTRRDDKTGLIIEKNPYKLIVIAAADGGKMRLWERPAGSGNIWNKHGEQAGRYVRELKAGKWTSKYDPEAKHVEFKVPETSDQILAKSLVAKDAQIEALKKELASIKQDAGEKQP